MRGSLHLFSIVLFYIVKVLVIIGKNEYIFVIFIH